MNPQAGLAEPVDGAEKAKVSACEACYQKKVKCDRGPPSADNTTPPCSRCKKKNIDCESRTRRRGRPFTTDVSSSSSNVKSEGSSKTKSERSHKTKSSSSRKVRSVSSKPRDRKKSTASPSTPVRFPASRRVAGWRSCEAFLAQADSEAQYKAVGNLLSTMKEMGSVANPDWLQWVCRGMINMALHDKSMGLLHAATTLAVSAGFAIDASYMEMKPEKERDYRSLITSRMYSVMGLLSPSPLHGAPFRGNTFDPAVDSVRDGPYNCGYLLQMDYGKRVIMPDALYQNLFGTQKEMTKMMAESPGMIKFWYPIVNAIGDLRPFAKEWVQKVLKELKPTPDGVLHFDITQKEVRIHDRKNHIWEADLMEATCVGDEGRRHWYLFSLLNMRRVRGERYDPAAPRHARMRPAFVVTKKKGEGSSRKRDHKSTTEKSSNSRKHSASSSGRDSPVSPTASSETSGSHSPSSSTSSLSASSLEEETDRPSKHHRKVKVEDSFEGGQFSFLNLREFDFENDDLAADILQWPSELEAPESQALNSTFSMLLDDYVVPPSHGCMQQR